MDVGAAALRRAEVWERAWPSRDIEAITALYSPSARYRALAFREPTSPRSYLEDTFAGESEVECRFGRPVVNGDRAAVEWWASWLENGDVGDAVRALVRPAGAPVLALQQRLDELEDECAQVPMQAVDVLRPLALGALSRSDQESARSSSP